MQNETITIDGFEFPKLYSDVPDVENLNYYLEKRFHQFQIVDYLSQRHHDIFPGHIGLYSDNNFNLKIVKWERSSVDEFGENAPGWKRCPITEPDKYKADILAFYEANDPKFFNFIKDRIG